jgi:hypothetical protein
MVQHIFNVYIGLFPFINPIYRGVRVVVKEASLRLMDDRAPER